MKPAPKPVLSTKLDDAEKEVWTTVHRFGGRLSGKALSLCGHVDEDEWALSRRGYVIIADPSLPDVL